MNQRLIVALKTKQNIKFINEHKYFSNGQPKKINFVLKTKQDNKSHNIKT